MRIFIDVETMPTRDPAVIAEIRANIKPPANYSKPESIAQWMETKGEEAAAEAIGRTALQPELGELIAVGIAVEDDPVQVLVRDPSEATDAGLLRAAIGYINDALEDAGLESPTDGERMFRPDPWWIAHNAAFDLAWLWKRAVIHGLSLPFKLPSPTEARHGKTHYCTMEAWAGYRDRISLDRLCRTLGIPSPKAGEISGTNAWQFWERGEIEAVQAYCAGDVEAARAVYHRLFSVNSGVAA